MIMRKYLVYLKLEEREKMSLTNLLFYLLLVKMIFTSMDIVTLCALLLTLLARIHKKELYKSKTKENDTYNDELRSLKSEVAKLNLKIGLKRE